jgi:hypothetical protein
VPFPTLWQSVPHVSHCYKSCPPQAGWAEPPISPLAGLFIYSLGGELSLPLSLDLRVARPLCCVPFVVDCLLLLFFCWAGGQSVQGAMLIYPRGRPSAAYLLICWSVSPKQFRSQHLASSEPSCFPCITWPGEAMSRLGVQGCRSFASSWWFFLPVVSLASQKDFYLKENTLLPPSSRHLGSSPYHLFKTLKLCNDIENKNMHDKKK